jgi:hypothetical protein
VTHVGDLAHEGFDGIEEAPVGNEVVPDVFNDHGKLVSRLVGMPLIAQRTSRVNAPAGA